jgi:putative FmdB family regulatory protein
VAVRTGAPPVTPLGFTDVESGLVPTYAYACSSCGHRFDIYQAFTDDALTECPECGGSLRKEFGNIGVVFKGAGFYRNDARKAGAAETAGSGSSTDSSSSASGSAKESSGSAKDSGSSSSAKESSSSSKDSGKSSGTSSGSAGSTSSPTKAASS